MQLSPSTFPIDPNLLGLLVPGGMPGAAPVAPAAPAGQAALSFAELLPGAEPGAAAPIPDSGNPVVGSDASLPSGRPEVPLLGAEPMPFQRFVAAVPELSSETPVAPAENEEAPSLPVTPDTKDKTPKPSGLQKRPGVRPEQPKKESAPELLSPAVPAAPLAVDLPAAPVSDEETAGRDAELPQSQPSISARAEISTRIKSAPVFAASFAPARAAATIPESGPTPVAPEDGAVPDPRPLTAQPVFEADLITPATPAPTPVVSRPQPRFPTPPQSSQGVDSGKLQPNLPPAPRSVEAGAAWSQRSLGAAQPILTAAPEIPVQPVSLPPVSADIAPQMPAPTAPPPTSLSAETIEATVAPALEPNVSLSPEAGLSAADAREHRENFAESADEFRVNFEFADQAPQKIFVGNEVERLTPRSKSVGIGVAKPAAPMPSRFSFLPTPHLAFEYAPAVAVSASGDRAASAMEAPAPASAPAAAPQDVASAHQAVEAVLRAVDHVATREQHAVNLHFSVGETDLKVRVELRADEVRTTFSTDSAELRSALSHEWQAVERSDAGGSVRIAPATFTSDHSASNLPGDASSRDRQQHQQAQHDQHQFAPGRAGFSRPASASPSDARPEVRSAPRFVHAGSRHLSTLA